MLDGLHAAYSLFGAFLASALATWVVLGWLRRRAILDQPNERSSHSLPTPRGGGLALTPVVLLGFALTQNITAQPDLSLAIVFLAGAVLALVSWTDDVKTLGPGPRFLAQLGTVAIALVFLAPDARLFEAQLPLVIERAILGLGWVWFINLFNFMDGINGITGAETASIGLGLTLVAAVGIGPAGEALGLTGLVLLGAALGFLLFNWGRAKLFLGDVGSVPLGFLLGFLLIDLALDGHLVPALILPLYYLMDATITLGRRMAAGHKPWQAHRWHFYQQAVKKGWSHARVSGFILGINTGLIGLALWSVDGGGIVALPAALFWVGGWLLALRGPLNEPAQQAD
ncbi:MAG: MraY family glycosyltransferase [Magnetovibrionaceae bacterium]